MDAVESVRSGCDALTGRPRPEWVRGICPQCGELLVSNCYYVGGRAYTVIWECWASLADPPACQYRKVV